MGKKLARDLADTIKNVVARKYRREKGKIVQCLKYVPNIAIYIVAVVCLD